MAWIKGAPITGFTFGMIDKNTGGIITSGTVTGYVTINGGVQSQLSNTPVHEGNGQWSVNLTSSEMSGEVIGLVFIHSLSVPAFFTILTESAGVNQVTITISDNNTMPIPDVYTTVYNSSNTVYLTGGTTNESGIVTLGLNNGTYKIRMRKAGVSFTIPETITVSGDTTISLVGNTIAIGAPDDSDSCRIYTYCYDLDGGDPIARITAYANISNDPYYQDGKYHFSGKVIGTYNAITGLLYWDIAQGAIAKIEISEIGYKKTVTIPAQSSVLLSSL